MPTTTILRWLRGYLFPARISTTSHGAGVVWLSNQLASYGFTPKSVMDFGCGTGSAVPYLLEVLGVTSVIGVDVSPKSIETAKQTYGCEQVRFMTVEDYRPGEDLDPAFCNGAFHHVPLSERASAIQYIYDSLRPGGLFALWENNP
jgi:trans-aconitate methyltransferase